MPRLASATQCRIESKTICFKIFISFYFSSGFLFSFALSNLLPLFEILCLRLFRIFNTKHLSLLGAHIPTITHLSSIIKLLSYDRQKRAMEKRSGISWAISQLRRVHKWIACTLTRSARATISVFSFSVIVLLATQSLFLGIAFRSHYLYGARLKLTRSLAWK